jgi:predicted MFS family arabinose efflux permease
MRQATPGYERTAAPREYSASSPPGPSVAIVAAICGAEILGLAGFSIVPALLPQFIDAWSLTNTQAGWLAGITSAGYMLAVIPLVSLTDRRPARQLYVASSALSALSCFGMALCDSLLPAIGFRALAGFAMAGMYMPGLRALTHGVEGATAPASRPGTPAPSPSARRCRSCSAASGLCWAGAAPL